MVVAHSGLEPVILLLHGRAEVRALCVAEIPEDSQVHTFDLQQPAAKMKQTMKSGAAQEEDIPAESSAAVDNVAVVVVRHMELEPESVDTADADIVSVGIEPAGDNQKSHVADPGHSSILVEVLVRLADIVLVGQ